MQPKAKPEGRAYHHGNLPEVLAAAAEALVREKGVHGFTLRECARRAGVAHSAPGHHFGDVTGLLSEVAARGFERLTSSMVAEREGASGPDRLRSIGRGYLAFAQSDPVIFVLMFHSDRVDHTSARLQAAGEAAFGELVDAITEARGLADRDEEALRFAWGAIHGIAMLLVDGPLKPGAGASRGEDAGLAEGTIERIVHAVVSFKVGKPARKR
jgi:AcrR family transcriptional regulator